MFLAVRGRWQRVVPVVQVVLFIPVMVVFFTMPEASDKGSQPYSRAVGTAKWLGFMWCVASVPLGTR